MLKSEASGKLFVVATPIGNLEDITYRAVRTLNDVDLIACEDTRRTKGLLDRYAIRTHLTSYHEHNEMTRAPELVLMMEEGSRIALVSDAGMPVISDPGYRLVKLSIRHGIPVIPIPGPSAFVAVLVASGLPVNRFRFAGFLESKRSARLKRLRELAGASETLIFYEAPHRIIQMLEDLGKIFGGRPVVVGREVTKMHEEFLRGTPSDVLQILKKRSVKGEMTVLLGAAEESVKQGKAPQPLPRFREEMERLTRCEKLSERDALKVLARSSGVSKSELYRRWQAEKER